MAMPQDAGPTALMPEHAETLKDPVRRPFCYRRGAASPISQGPVAVGAFFGQYQTRQEPCWRSGVITSAGNSSAIVVMFKA